MRLKIFERQFWLALVVTYSLTLLVLFSWFLPSPDVQNESQVHHGSVIYNILLCLFYTLI